METSHPADRHHDHIMETSHTAGPTPSNNCDGNVEISQRLNLVLEENTRLKKRVQDLEQKVIIYEKMIDQFERVDNLDQVEKIIKTIHIQLQSTTAQRDIGVGFGQSCPKEIEANKRECSSEKPLLTGSIKTEPAEGIFTDNCDDVESAVSSVPSADSELQDDDEDQANVDQTILEYDQVDQHNNQVNDREDLVQTHSLTKAIVPNKNQTSIISTIRQALDSPSQAKLQLPYFCYICAKSYKHEKELESHLDSHSENTCCPICNEEFVTKEAKVSHLMLQSCRTEHSDLTQRSGQSDLTHRAGPSGPTRRAGLSGPTATDVLEGTQNKEKKDEVNKDEEKNETAKEPKRRGKRRCTTCKKITSACICPSKQDERMGESGEKKSTHIACNICGKVYSCRGTMLLHRRRIHEGGKIMDCCEICGRKLERRVMKSHMATHSDVKPHKCHICGKDFVLEGDLKRHIKVRHLTEKTVHLCPECGKGFASADNLSGHRNYHKQAGSQVCPTCGYKCARSNTLKRHMNRHTHEKVYKCPVCDRAFAWKAAMENHTKVHEADHEFMWCQICGRKHLRKHQEEHMKKHDIKPIPVRPNKCPFCEMSFSRTNKLKIHITRFHSHQHGEAGVIN